MAMNTQPLYQAVPLICTNETLPRNAIVLGLTSGKNLPGMTLVYREFRDSYVTRKVRNDIKTLCFDFYVPFFVKYHSHFKDNIAKNDLPFFFPEKSLTPKKTYRKLIGDELDQRLCTDLANSKFKGNRQENVRVNHYGSNDDHIPNNTDDPMSVVSGLSTFQPTNFDATHVSLDSEFLPDKVSSAADDGASMELQQIDVNKEDPIGAIGSVVESRPGIPDTIHEACTSGSLDDVIRFIMSDNATLELKNDDLGQTPLMIAVQYGHSDMVKYLIDLNPSLVNTDVSDNHKLTIVHYACKYGSLYVLERLRYTDVGHFNAKTKYGSSAFHYACLGGQERIVDELLTKHGINFAGISNAGLNAIHYACMSGNVNIVAKLLSTPELGYNVLSSDKNQMNVFHYACMSGFITIVEHLYNNYSNEINVRSVDKDGKNGLHLAAERGHIDVVQYLVEAIQIPVESLDNHENTVLHAAIACQYKKSEVLSGSDNDNLDVSSDEGKVYMERLDQKILEVVSYCINKANANVMAVNKQHWNILHTASRYCRKNIVEYLLKNPIVHANVEARDENGWTALHHAIIGGDFEVVKCLITNGNALVNQTNRDGWTVLHYACRNGYFDAAQSLIKDFGADITAVNKFGQTPRDVANERNHQEIERYLEGLEN